MQELTRNKLRTENSSKSAVAPSFSPSVVDLPELPSLHNHNQCQSIRRGGPPPPHQPPLIERPTPPPTPHPRHPRHPPPRVFDSRSRLPMGRYQPPPNVTSRARRGHPSPGPLPPAATFDRPPTSILAVGTKNPAVGSARRLRSDLGFYFTPGSLDFSFSFAPCHGMKSGDLSDRDLGIEGRQLRG
jgi:hypothetical protein